MLWSDLELSADVVLDDFPQECVAFVRHDIIVAQARTDKHLFDAGQSANFPKQGNIVSMIHREIFAGSGVKALTRRAGTARQLPLAGGTAKIGRGSAHIVDEAFKVRHLRDAPSLVEYGFMAARGDDAPLMKRDGAKAAGAKAPARMAIENLTSSIAGTPPSAS